jgi:hypothetical protein
MKIETAWECYYVGTDEKGQRRELYAQVLDLGEPASGGQFDLIIRDLEGAVGVGGTMIYDRGQRISQTIHDCQELVRERFPGYKAERERHFKAL